MGVCIEPPECIFGLSRFEQFIYRDAEERAKKAGKSVHPQPRSEPGDLDLCIYGLKKYARLAATGNPSILALLFTSPLYSTEAGAELVAQRDMFVTREVGKKFLGDLRDQHERLTGKRGQMRVTRNDLIEAHGFDTKYAGHAVRLGLQGQELMEYGTLSLPMPIEQRWLVRNVRLGKYSFEEVLEIIAEVEADLKYAIQKAKLPEGVNRERINNFLERIYRDNYR